MLLGFSQKKRKPRLSLLDENAEVFTELTPLDFYRTFDKDGSGRIDEARFSGCPGL